MMQIPSSALILVAVVNKPRDLEIARVLGWYRIPLRTAPKVLSVDYLAFYQTGAFGENKWQIQFAAPVRGHELTTRAELLRDELDHPRAPHEYFKLQIGPLFSLSRPIPAGNWRRITFFYTTGEYCAKAGSVNDLVIQSEDRQGLWQALRERAGRDQAYTTEDLPGDNIDPSILALLLGISDIH